VTCPEFSFNRRNFFAATAALGVTGFRPPSLSSLGLHSVKGMSQKDLDYLLDPNANTIGSIS
jgi:hypothetical protein